MLSGSKVGLNYFPDLSFGPTSDKENTYQYSSYSCQNNYDKKTHQEFGTEKILHYAYLKGEKKQFKEVKL